MPCPHKKKRDNPESHREHTEITSERQRGLFGAELARRRAGESSRIPSVTTAELERHLREAPKKLPARARDADD